ncbi:MAG TPA: ABC transporter permease [Candidatus Obscuribacterales bacterium]|jgi:NitT/TauT family transport system permease protein
MPKKLLEAWSSLWKIRGSISQHFYSLLVVLSIVLPLVGWATITYSGWVDHQFLPSPTAVLARGYLALQSGELISDLIASLSRVIWGFLASAIISVPLGLLIGSFKSIEGLLEPILSLLRYMPTAAFIPLIILWVGIDEPAKIAIIFLGTFFYNVLMIADAVKFVPSDLINVSYTLGAKGKDIFCDIIFPATLPNIIDTLRINIATAWNFVVIAELIAASSGLGYRILVAQRAYQTDAIFVGIIVIGLIGLLIDFSFKLLFRLVVPWAIDKNH